MSGAGALVRLMALRIYCTYMRLHNIIWMMLCLQYRRCALWWCSRRLRMLTLKHWACDEYEHYCASVRTTCMVCVCCRLFAAPCMLLQYYIPYKLYRYEWRWSSTIRERFYVLYLACNVLDVCVASCVCHIIQHAYHTAIAHIRTYPHSSAAAAKVASIYTCRARAYTHTRHALHSYARVYGCVHWEYVVFVPIHSATYVKRNGGHGIWTCWTFFVSNLNTFSLCYIFNQKNNLNISSTGRSRRQQNLHNSTVADIRLWKHIVKVSKTRPLHRK